MRAPCTSIGCENEAVVRGMCKKHYCAAMHAGMLTKIERSVDCSVHGCDMDRYCKGLCKLHYDRKRTTGSTKLQSTFIAQTLRKLPIRPIRPLVAASIKRAAIKEVRRQRLVKRGLTQCEF